MKVDRILESTRPVFSFEFFPPKTDDGRRNLEDALGELKKDEPVVVYCAYGFHVGCRTAITLREAGFDAKYMNVGHSGWRAVGAPTKLYSS